MTKRTNKPKAAQTVAPTINSTAPVSPTEDVKAESKAKVASKGKQANTTAKKGISAANKSPAKPRARSKKAVPVEQKKELIAVELVQDSAGKVVAKEARPYASAGNAVPSKYEQFKAWLVFKLYVVTSYFRGY